MKLANKAFILTLTMLALVFSMSAQTLRPIDDPRNTAPTVGTGGPPGGPTGLFTVYDGQTLRRGEFTFSAAYSNYDRDPGDVDISEVPLSFQVGVNDHIELFFNTDAWRGIKVNAPQNLSSFYLPNSQLSRGSGFQTPGAIVLGTGTFAGSPTFRPAGAAFTQFPFVGGFINGNLVSIGSPSGGSGNSAASFPGLGSVYGSILPGIVLQTNTITIGTAPRTTVLTNPTSFTVAPTYLPDAPFINRTWGQTAFNTFTVGGKIRFTGPDNPYGIGLIPFYRFYADKADSFSGFNQLQRGASPGGNRGDFGLVLVGDARLRRWVNVSANIGYIYNSSVKADFPGGRFTILDRPDEVLAAIGVDFPVNKHFQPILEFRSDQYVGGRTPNALERSPLDGLAGARVYPNRWMSLGAAYRYNFNQQSARTFNSNSSSFSTTLPNGTVASSSTISGVPPGFQTSTDPNGFMFQITAGRRNARRPNTKPNIPADVTNLTLSDTRVTSPCAAGTIPAEGANCSTNMSVNVTTTAVDPENDVLTYSYTVSGGRVVGQGANVSWDLTGVQPGTYTITAGVDDGCGICGKTQTKTITVEECHCISQCVCPTLTVTGPSGVTSPGGTMTFTANLSGGSSTDYTYTWTVTQGTITAGQGTPSITVSTTQEMAGGNVTATVTVTSAICTSCNKTESETAGIQAAPTSRLFTEFTKAVPDEIKAQLQAFYVELGNNPNAQGYIINSGTNKDVARREKQIRDAIRFLKLDINRVTFVTSPDTGQGIRTRFYVVPAGATPPTE